ncbi:MAG: ABC transporter ATP-binding protein [Deltaproteobacteria bacterium]|nr:ABC transporter ATP-binding protein [Deltaproteobacteria bacterium]
MGFLQVRQLRKRFERVTAVDGVDLDIEEGEFFTLLGPSGCGKTTTLRVVAGLERPDSGEIHLGERCLLSHSQRVFVQPERREMGMVFQSYALWPHMTVFDNVAYPLRLRRVKAPVVRQKVMEALALVGLAGLEDRPAPALSGGQQQRVALARALVFSPRVLLLDEPLSNLDARLREEMRRELKALQRRIRVTVLFVTHDQIEGLSLSDRIGIMNGGKLEQVGCPEEVYYRPATPFARDFLGKTFALGGKVFRPANEGLEVRLDGMACSPLQVAAGSLPSARGAAPAAGDEVMVAIRPEQIAIWNSTPAGIPNVVPATLEGVHFLGDRYEYTVSLGSVTRLLIAPASPVLKAGQRVFLELKSEGITLWPRSG